jgi:hypothetical protein
VSVTAVALEVDTLLVGYSDGAVSLWRLSGLDGLSSLLQAWPACRARPDAALRAPGGGAGAVLGLSLSRDDDLGAVAYAHEVWLYELARARPLLHVALAPPLLPAAPGGWAAAGAVINADGGLVVAANGGAGGELLLFDAAAPAVAAPAPAARAPLPGGARATCLVRLRGGGVGDWEGPGAVVAAGTDAGDVLLFDGRSLARLAAWRASPRALAVTAVDVSPDLAYLVVGCADGTVAALALPAFAAVVAVDRADDADRDGVAHALVGGALALGSAAAASAETARGVARSAKAVASETGSAVVRSLFSGWGGAKKK